LNNKELNGSKNTTATPNLLGKLRKLKSGTSGTMSKTGKKRKTGPGKKNKTGKKRKTGPGKKNKTGKTRKTGPGKKRTTIGITNGRMKNGKNPTMMINGGDLGALPKTKPKLSSGRTRMTGKISPWNSTLLTTSTGP